MEGLSSGRPHLESNDRGERELGEAFGIIGSLLRRPSRLVGTRFRETPEYPDFAWREAILNAVAHRDYAVEGRTTEVYLFDDRMEVTSPGGLATRVSLEALRARTRVQAPRSLIDYVIAHELVHLEHPHHGAAFWSALGKVMPDYEARKARLRLAGPRLIW